MGMAMISATTIELWLWRIPGRNGRLRTLRWYMTEVEAVQWGRTHGVVLTRVEGSRETRRVVPSSGGLMEKLGTPL